MSEQIDFSGIQCQEEGCKEQEEYFPEPEPEYEMEMEHQAVEIEKFSIERRNLILLLEQYMEHFSHKLKKFSKINLEHLNISELEKLKDEMDFVLGCRSSVNTGVQAFATGLQALEYVAVNYTPLKLEGLSQLSTDPDVIDDVKLIMLQNTTIIKTKPEHRLLYKLISTSLLLHNLNSSREALAQAQETQTLETQSKEKKLSGAKITKLEKLEKKYMDL